MNIMIVDCFDTWEHRVDLLHDIFTKEGHRVTCLLSDYRHFEKVRRTDKKQDFIFFPARPYKKNISKERLLSHIKLGEDLFDYIDKQCDSVDLLWVLTPPNVFVRNAGRIKKRHNHIKLVLDFIDLWPETMPFGMIKPLLHPWKKLRNNFIRYADVIVTECDLYQKALGKVLNDKCVETLYLAREDMGYTPNLALSDDKISLCYLGSINNIIDIDGIVKIVDWIHRDKGAILHIVGNGEKKEELVAKAQATGADVIDHGIVYDRGEKQTIFDSCHFGLNVMKESVCVGLTMKSIDYFEFGLPIINTIPGDTWDLVNQYGCGFNLDFNKQIDFSNHHNLINYNPAFREKSRKVFDELLCESVFERKVCAILEKVELNNEN